ncbi:hypothetical protein [Mycobacterium vicinigordonae]|uniref:hypothetical protein n=1 Tax=Mycobacterium vicinigordonae TaxID=1719132 RepID=UPI0031B600F1
MSTVNGLPAHILFNHLVVVLGPLSAILAILCAVWSAARQHLIWLTLVLTVITLVVTPLTTSSGEWLAGKVGASPAVDRHAELGETLVYLIATLAVAATALAVAQLRVVRDRPVKPVVHIVIRVFVVAAAVGTLVQTYRVGESGARAAWGSVAASLPAWCDSGYGSAAYFSRLTEQPRHGAAVQ